MSRPNADPILHSFSEASADSKRRARRKRNHPPPFSIRFTDEERAYLTQQAGALSLAAYIRLKLFSDADRLPSSPRMTKKSRSPSAELTVLGHMLGGLGQSRLASNLNQIAKAANIGALPVTPELEAELNDACSAVKEMRRDLIEALGIEAK